MNPAICAFEEDAEPAGRLARELGAPLHTVSVHRFPDGECLPMAPVDGFDDIVVYRSLHHPDAKLVPLLLLADAVRRLPAKRLLLVAPYMPYLRQDAIFAAGQPVSRDVIARLLGAAFDTVITVQPHLHRTRRLAPLFEPASVVALSAAGLLAHAIGDWDDPLIVGPDVESLPWARAIAARLGGDSVALAKSRTGDRQVTLTLADPIGVKDRRVVLIDDICSTGETLKAAARYLCGEGARSVEIAVVHALISDDDLARLLDAGVSRLVSTDSCLHQTNAIGLAPLIARRLRRELACNR